MKEWELKLTGKRGNPTIHQSDKRKKKNSDENIKKGRCAIKIKGHE